MNQEKNWTATGAADPKKYHKAAFEKIPDEKREKILTVAASEFAGKGFDKANINVIAKKAGISIGSMYNYFSSKENLFLAIVEYGYDVLESVIADIDLDEGDIFDKIEKLLRAAQKFSRQYRELSQIYLDITTEGLAHLSVALSRKVESVSAVFYRALINQAKKDGRIDETIDEYVAAYCLDNLILLLQYSYITDYFKERMKIFAGPDALENDEKIIAGMMRFIRKGLSG